MVYLLDTDTCGYAMRGAAIALDTRLAKAEPQALAISAVTRAELMFGLEKRGNPKPLTRLVMSFLEHMPVLPWDTAAADRFAKLRAALERAGTPIGLMDSMIAAHALALGAILVTNNQKHFQKVATLKLENWTK
jgi:tRNA(fMet)-specific endonuclease VapC